MTTPEMIHSPKLLSSFNTASGMRSHVTEDMLYIEAIDFKFQYRKRYEVTCDIFLVLMGHKDGIVSIPQAV